MAVGQVADADQAFREGLTCADIEMRPGSVALTSTLTAAAASQGKNTGPVAHTLGVWIRLGGLAGEDVLGMVNFYEQQLRDRPKDRGTKQRLARSYAFVMAMTTIPRNADGQKVALGYAQKARELYTELLKIEPSNGMFSLEEAQLCFFTASKLALNPPSYDQTIDWCTEGLAILDRATFDPPQARAAQTERVNLRVCRFWTLGHKRDRLGALADVAEIMRLDPQTRNGPLGVAYDECRKGVHEPLKRSIRELKIEPPHAGRIRDALSQAEAVAARPDLPGEILYDAACAFAVLADIVSEAETQKKYATRAVATLRLAHKSGIDPSTINNQDPLLYMEADSDLAELHKRDDYMQLVCDVAAGRP